MQQAPIRRSDPQAAVAIPKQTIGRELPPNTWKRIYLRFPFNKPSDCAAHGDQECAVVAFA
jgi:hypothetical protein